MDIMALIVSILGIIIALFIGLGQIYFAKKMKDFDPETAGSTIQALGTKSLAFGVNLSF